MQPHPLKVPSQGLPALQPTDRSSWVLFMTLHMASCARVNCAVITLLP